MAANPVPGTFTERRLAALEQARLARQQATQSQDRFREVTKTLNEGRDRHTILNDSAYARLAARLETMPVIEQAKGILMAQTGCTADEAFEALRTASQRSNVKIREIAGKLVEGAVRKDRPRRAN